MRLRNIVLERLSIIQIRGRALSGRITRRDHKKYSCLEALLLSILLTAWYLLPFHICLAMKKCLSHRSILKEFNWLFFFTETQHAATLFIGNIRLLMFLCKFYDPLHILDIQCCYRESWLNRFHPILSVIMYPAPYPTKKLYPILSYPIYHPN